MDLNNPFNNSNDNDYIENWYERDIFLSEFSEDGNIFCHSFQNGLVRQYEEDHSYSDENNYCLNILKSKVNGDIQILCEFNNGNNKNISTKENSNENEETKNVKVSKNSKNKEEIKIEKSPKFKTKKNSISYWRFDAAKKFWKTKISNNSTDYINKVIKSSDMPEEYKKKIHKPNSKLFTANVKESDNCEFLEKDLRTIFTIGKESNPNQQNNENNISKIYEYFEKVGYNNLSDEMLGIKKYFEMKYEDLIKQFYKSDELINFKKEEKTIFFDKGTKDQEGFAISEDLGLIRIFRRKRKRD